MPTSNLGADPYGRPTGRTASGFQPVPEALTPRDHGPATLDPNYQATVRPPTSKRTLWLAAHPQIRQVVEAIGADLGVAEAAAASGFAATESAREAKGQAKAVLARLEDDYFQMGREAPADELAVAKEGVASTNRGHDQVQQQGVAAGRRAADVRQTHESIFGCIDDLVASGREPVFAKPPRVPDEKLRDFIDAQRATQRGLHATIKDTEDAPRPMEEVEAVHFAAIGSLAASALPKVGIGKNPVLTWPLAAVSKQHLPDRDVPYTADGVAFFAYLATDVLKAHVHNQLVERYIHLPPPLSESQKRQRIAKLRAEILESERLECGAIWESRAQGIDIAFRADTDPRAVLGIA